MSDEPRKIEGTEYYAGAPTDRPIVRLWVDELDGRLHFKTDIGEEFIEVRPREFHKVHLA